MANQSKTTEKVLLTILVIAFIGLASVFASAALGNSESSNPAAVKVLYSDDEHEDEFGEDNDMYEDEESDVPITGTALDKASAAALAYIGEGRVSDTEVGDEEGFYEIEVTLDNGREVDVHLNEDFNVISVEY